MNSKVRGFVPTVDVAKFMSDKLAGSGLTDKDGKALGFEPRDPTWTAGYGFWRGKPFPCFTIPYINPWGDEDWDNFLRARYAGDLPPKSPISKYTQLAGSPIHAYFPEVLKSGRTWKDVLQDPTTPLIITEGELKAACATKRGFPTIGLGGVDSFRSKKRGIKFLPELEKTSWEDRKVYIIYDSDLALKPDVMRARQVLANELIDRGAIVWTVQLPDDAGKKVGLDDYLVANDDAAFALLIKGAYQMDYGWRFLYQTTDKGVPLATLYNANIAVEHGPEFTEVFAYDEMLRETTVLREYPNNDLGPYPRAFTDADTTCVQLWLQGSCGLAHIGPDVTLQAVEHVAREHRYHPIRDYLESLEWDGVERCPEWLIKAFGADDTVYVRSMGTMFLMSMVERVFEPGCQVDYMMVLEGGQGLHKSTACRILAGDAYFSDSLPTDDKDQKTHLNGKWLVEMSELATLKKSEVEEVKSFVTRRTEKYRPPFGKKDVEQPRQCVFIGTTNETQYLRDDTDNRRFWPVRAHADNIDWLRKNRDQLLAEAVVRLRRGEPKFPDKEFEREHFKPEQAARFAGGEWDDSVRTYVEAEALKSPAIPPENCRISKDDIATFLNIELVRRTPETTKKINATMRRIGWVEKGIGKNRFVWTPGQDLLVELNEKWKPKAKSNVTSIKSKGKKF
jgi:predicted P-loop ATPase